MPLYAYRCISCAHTFGELQRIGDTAPEACPKCGCRVVEKLISAGCFQMHGEGVDRPAKREEETTGGKT